MGADTNNGHTEAKFLILCSSNSNPKPKMGANSSAENTPKNPESIFTNCLPNFSAKSQKFLISMKKGFRSQWKQTIKKL